MSRILLFGIPQILLSGLVQEGAKLVPVVLYWRREGRSLDPKLGLAVGAVMVGEVDRRAGHGVTYEAESGVNVGGF